MLLRDNDGETRFIGAEIPGILHRRMKIEALERNTTMRQLVIEALACVYGQSEMVKPHTGRRMVVPQDNSIKL